MRFRQIADGLYQATRKATNVYLVTLPDGSILIDTGEPSFADAILRALEGFPPVRHILLTHAHYDHSGSAAALSDKLEAPVWAHPAEVALLEAGAWRRVQTPSPSLFGYLATHLIAYRFPDKVAAPHRLMAIKETHILDLETLGLPGHSDGQLGFGVTGRDGAKAWIVGDTIMTAPGVREPILYEDRGIGLTSIAKLAETITEGDLVCPGHGKARCVDAIFIEKLRRISRRT
ncbi:MAG: MBL fold metallo-hydrolase [Pseudomonadota bacterium]